MKTVIIAIVTAVAIVAALALTQFVIPTKAYNTLIKQVVSQRLGSNATVGKIRIRILPRPHFTITDLIISSVEPEFQAKPIARAGTIEGTFSMLGILKNRLHTDLTVHDFEINYIAAPSGAHNLDRPLAVLSAPSENGPLKEWDISIERITAYRGRVGSANLSKLILSNLNSKDGVSGRAAFAAAMFGKQKPNVEFGSNFSFNSANGTLHLRQTKMSIEGISITMDSTLELRRKPMQFVVHAATPGATVQLLSLVFDEFKDGFPAGIALGGPAALDLYLKGSSQQTTIRLQAELSRTNITVGKVFVKPQGRLMKLGFAGVNTPAQLKIEALNLRLGENLIQITGSMLHQPDHQAQLNITSEGFNLSEIQPSLPMLGIFENATNPSAVITVQGSLDDPANRLLFGKIIADSLNFMGMDLSKPSVDFHQKQNQIALPHIKANALGGSLSANGNVDLSGTPRFNVQSVVSGCDMEKIKMLRGAIRGKGDLVVAVASTGSDAATIASSTTASGTMVLERAQIPPLDISKGLLAEKTWKFVEAQFEDLIIPTDAIDKLSAITSDAEDLHITFSGSKTENKISDLRYINPDYVLWLRGRIDAQDVIDATGSIWLKRKWVNSLFPDAKLRKTIANSSGDLQIPFSMRGTGNGLILRLQEGAFKSVLEGRAAPTPTVGAMEKKVIEPVEKKSEVKKKKEKKPTPKKKARPRTKKRAAPSRSRAIPQSESDDVMKVLIR